ncbi:hypothetical protein [Streptomyces diastatochromogenes]|uniref:Uncharacterized protein n=1 Tax=Streptomyces diastatochromogenes TaxID=42236 RepID=A0A233RNT0_STRDA|nr:hypothetical protein [Streptomyces diastatochromogenes]MCZ0984559.1 hypothetical protein [Streptomyces diastatochromogenes]OXY85022.1 hypothetical protein BEK98_46090 [Streptomyces diastatochromogenes]
MWIALVSLILLLGAASAIIKARKGQWYAAAGIFLAILSVDLMLFGGLERHSPCSSGLVLPSVSSDSLASR